MTRTNLVLPVFLCFIYFWLLSKSVCEHRKRVPKFRAFLSNDIITPFVEDCSKTDSSLYQGALVSLKFSLSAALKRRRTYKANLSPHQ